MHCWPRPPRSWFLPDVPSPPSPTKASARKPIGPRPAAATDEADYSRLAEIHTGNVSRLGLAWSLDLPGEVTLEATPLAVDGVLYFSGSYAAVYAVDAASGKLLWKYDPQTWKHNPAKMHFSFGANRGAAYEDGKGLCPRLSTAG